MTHDLEEPAAPGAGLFGLDSTSDDAAIVLVPVPFDATASYRRNAKEGPRTILAASHQLDLFDLRMGQSFEQGIVMLSEDAEVHAYNSSARTLVDAARALPRDSTERKELTHRANQLCQKLNDWVMGKVGTWVARGRVVGVVGGDHAVAYGAISAHLQQYPELGILQVDAHADLRAAYEGFSWSHASIMFNVLTHTQAQKLVQVGVRDLCRPEYERINRSNGRVRAFFGPDIAQGLFEGRSFRQMLDDMVAAMPKEVYVSFDIDGLDPALCPNTGTPVPGGLSFEQAAALLAAVTDSGRRIVGFDLCEVAPGTPDDQWDGNVGARILYKLCGHALNQGHGRSPTSSGYRGSAA